MTLELVAVQGCTITHSSGSPISGGSFTITSSPSTKVKCEGSGVYKGTIAFTFSGGNGSGAVPGSVAGAGTIVTTALKTKADAEEVVREGDTGTLTATGTKESPPPPTVPFVGGVEISVAGQTTVKAQ
jgi:hypothetical protein